MSSNNAVNNIPVQNNQPSFFSADTKKLVSGFVQEVNYAAGISIVWYALDRYMQINSSSGFVKDYLIPAVALSATIKLIRSVDYIALVIIGDRPNENKSGNRSNILRQAVWTVIILAEKIPEKFDEIGTYLTLKVVNYKVVNYIEGSLLSIDIPNQPFIPYRMRTLKEINAVYTADDELEPLEVVRATVIKTVSDYAVNMVSAYMGMRTINHLNPTFLRNLYEKNNLDEGFVSILGNFKGMPRVIFASMVGVNFAVLTLLFVPTISTNFLLSESFNIAWNLYCNVQAGFNKVIAKATYIKRETDAMMLSGGMFDVERARVSFFNYMPTKPEKQEAYEKLSQEEKDNLKATRLQERALKAQKKVEESANKRGASEKSYISRETRKILKKAEPQENKQTILELKKKQKLKTQQLAQTEFELRKKQKLEAQQLFKEKKEAYEKLSQAEKDNLKAEKLQKRAAQKAQKQLEKQQSTNKVNGISQSNDEIKTNEQ